MQHVVSSAIEHPAITKCLDHLAASGRVEVTYVGVDREGRVSVEEVVDALRPDTALVTVMHSNNEVLFCWWKVMVLLFPVPRMRVSASRWMSAKRSGTGERVYWSYSFGSVYIRRASRARDFAMLPGRMRGTFVVCWSPRIGWNFCRPLHHYVAFGAGGARSAARCHRILECTLF